MKKILMLLLAISSLQLAYAYDAANIKIKIAGAIQKNDYFLCVPDLGCLSILDAQKGKIYPITHELEMENMYVLNADGFRLTPLGLPKSCNVKVATHQTITISGKLVKGPQDVVHINQLHCSVS